MIDLTHLLYQIFSGRLSKKSDEMGKFKGGTHTYNCHWKIFDKKKMLKGLQKLS